MHRDSVKALQRDNGCKPISNNPSGICRDWRGLVSASAEEKDEGAEGTLGIMY